MLSVAARLPEDDVGPEADQEDVARAHEDEDELHEAGRLSGTQFAVLDEQVVAGLEGRRREQADGHLVGGLRDVLAELPETDEQFHDPDLQVVEDATQRTAAVEVGGQEADELHGETGQREADDRTGDGGVRGQREADRVDQALCGDHVVVEQRDEADADEHSRDREERAPEVGQEELLAGQRVIVVHGGQLELVLHDAVDPVGLCLPRLEVIPADEHGEQSTDEPFSTVAHQVPPVVGEDHEVPELGDRGVGLEDQVVDGGSHQHPEIAGDQHESQSLAGVGQFLDPGDRLVPPDVRQRSGQLDHVDLLAVLAELPAFGRHGRRCDCGVGHRATSLSSGLT